LFSTPARAEWPVLVPSRTQARPKAVIAMARSGRSLLLDQGRRRVHRGVFPSCSRRRDSVAPPSASAGRTSVASPRPGRHTRTPPRRRNYQSDPEGFVGRANQIESRRTFVERGPGDDPKECSTTCSTHSVRPTASCTGPAGSGRIGRAAS
jgi:hypothetical protein